MQNESYNSILKCNKLQRKKKPPPDKQFFISVPVKPYVKRFLHLNYGDPVFFHSDQNDYNFLRKCLADSRKREPKIPEYLSPYKETVTILLSERDFYRYGWDMTYSNIVKFGIYFERKAKSFMRTIVGIYHSFGSPIQTSILKFQENFYFDEGIWPMESIKKDFYRNGIIQNIDFEQEVEKKIEKIVLTNLSFFGTLSESFIKDHENDKQTW